MRQLQHTQVWASLLMGFLLRISLRSRTTIVCATVVSSGSTYFSFQQAQYPRDCKEALNSCERTHNVSGVYIVKPDGYPEPFEVYCDNDVGTGGWTVIQRRSEGYVNFNRNWEDFKQGFGFLGSQFWMGNEKVAYFTNQKQYELRLEFQNAAGESYHVNYGNFRISDEYGSYLLSSVSSYKGIPDSYIEWCPANKVFSNQTCEKTCDNPENCISGTSKVEEEKCVCIGDYKIQDGNCVSNNKCGCFVADKRNVLQNGESYVNSNCTKRTNCSNNVLNVEDDFACSDYATCMERNGVRKCSCNNGFEGDGVTCTLTLIAEDCQGLYAANISNDGIYLIYPDGYPGGIQVYCEMESYGGGWTIIQRRSNNSIDFDRIWSEYENGFGNSREDHWLGNKYIHAITNQKSYQVRIDVTDSRSSSYYATYASFSISNADDKYRLSIGTWSSGDAVGDAFRHHNNKQFSTRDQDNDARDNYNCAEGHTGGWWFGDVGSCDSSYCVSGQRYCEHFQVGSCCTSCGMLNLNGYYNGSVSGRSIFWSGLRGYDCGLQYTEMKIRPV